MRYGLNQIKPKTFAVLVTIMGAMSIISWPISTIAENDTDLVTPQSLILTDAADASETPVNRPPRYSSYTKYEATFLPGINPCNHAFSSNSDTTECQESSVIQGLSTNTIDTYQIKPSAIIEDQVQPRGNLFQIKFDRRIRTKRE